MMSRVDELKKSRDSTSVKFLEFTRVVSKPSDRIAIFFEGEDEKYFSVRINTIRPDINWVGINSKGKSNVIKLRERIRNHPVYKTSFCMFFVDSDFDTNTEINNLHDLYITPCYSVENLYISDAAFKRIIAAEFGLSEVTEERECYEKVFDIYRKSKEDYIKKINGFNFLIREVRLKEQRGELSGKLNINELSLDDLVDIELGYVHKKYDESKPHTIFHSLAEDLAIPLAPSIQYFKDLSGEKWFRGKQHLEFVRNFLVKIKEDRCKKHSRTIFNAKGNVKLNLTKANSISELSQYADTPCCLKEFLEKQSFIKVAA